jgi:hypothetical protein
VQVPPPIYAIVHCQSGNTLQSDECCTEAVPALVSKSLSQSINQSINLFQIQADPDTG